MQSSWVDRHKRIISGRSKVVQLWFSIKSQLGTYLIRIHNYFNENKYYLYKN